MSKETKTTKDRSGAIGLGTTGAGAVVGGTSLAVLTGGSASASAITYALGTIGGVVGGGMAAGLGVLIGGPALLGIAAYGVAKAVRNRKQKKQ